MRSIAFVIFVGESQHGLRVGDIITFVLQTPTPSHQDSNEGCVQSATTLINDLVNIIARDAEIY